ncbi:unnamed protein product [Prorocentrum cordatum]|uniref:RanBP2-type domain-containing protein n=1 Tax=Prorocentrum cordatum TaxID=2364126 RepID=A0ABN9WUD6_9DINO|nr:unnamed protein product [Polarella glacialis]
MRLLWLRAQKGCSFGPVGGRERGGSHARRRLRAAMGKKAAPKAAKPDKEEAEDAPEGEGGGGAVWVCSGCEQENGPEEAVCVACEEPRPVVADAKFENFVVGVVRSCEAVPKKDKLRQLEVDVGEDSPLKIVTNAGNVKEGSRVVVAKVGP